ncbi:Pol, partial [Symbiodinium necroappetens]
GAWYKGRWYDQNTVSALQQSQPCDLINFYQHAWHDTDHTRSLRHQALDSLTRVIQQAMVLGLDLCVLNTFQSSHPPHTYCWGTQRSHIDFIMIKRDLADGHSRQSHAKHDHPLGCWRGGARHFPVHAGVPVIWRPWSQSPQDTVTKAIDRHAIADALAGKADPRVQDFRRDLQTQLDSISHDLVALHDTVRSLAIKHFPKKAPVREQRPWQDGTLQQYASLMGGHLRKLRRWASRPAAYQRAQALFQCWRHSVQFARMHRMAQRQGKELRRARRANLLMQADQAISSGSSRLFYQLVDKLAPKGRYRKFQLSRGGSILTPEEELDTMRKHFTQVFNGDNTQLPTPPELHAEDSSLPVDSRELQVFLDKLPARKAGAPHTAPGAVWCMCSDLVATPLAKILTQRWSQAPLQPPDNWAKATLSLLLKPHKTGSSPKDFRPIGLLDALGKASISMLLSKLRFDLETYVRTTPQFAYVTGRSTSDALRRVFLHNHDARALRSPSTRDPHFKRAGGRSPSLQGGLQVCLDLTSAFDYVPRHLIAEALHEAGITGAPAELLLNWLHQCTYDLYIDQQHTSIPTNRGVKQGCPASPLLFAAFMTLVTRRLSSRLTTEWVERCLTMFADDFHIGQCFHSYHELETLSSRIGYIMSTLRSHGMSVHATKAKAIITIEGTKRSTAVKKLVRTSEDGRLFRIHTKQGDEFLPLVRQADYLGLDVFYMLTVLSPSRTGSVQTLVLKHLRGIARKTFESAFGRQEPDDPHVLPYDHDWNLHLASRLMSEAQDLQVASLKVPKHPFDRARHSVDGVSVSRGPAPQKGTESEREDESFGSVLVAAGKRGTDEKPTGAPQDRLPKVGRGSVALGGQGKGFQGKGGRRRPGKNQNGRPQSDSGNSSFLSGSTTDGEDAELLHLVARAIVRHEDTLNVLRRSTGWVFWIRSGDHSILPTLVDLASKWREVAEKQEIQADHISLRVTLLWGIFTTLKEKLSHLSQEQLAYANRASWIDTSSNWNFQRWDSQHQMLIVDTYRPPLSLAQIQESLATLLRVINGDTLTRFAATKGISADMQGTVLFQADISLR